MSSDLSPLVADDGELRLARRVASYVYGRREVTWPEDVDDPEDDLPDEREFGWTAKLPGPEPGLSERRFVRGDVQIDAVEQVSEVEQVLDDAASRAGGDVFFESMIEGRGLGRLVPGRDFDEGDLVDVRFWGRVLPDQLVTAVEWHDGVPSVKLGGQALSDVSDLGRARAETLRLIRRERSERQGDVAKVSAAASAAQSTADTARGEVQAVRESLAGQDAGEPDLLAQLVAVNNELQRLGQDPQPSLMLAFVAMSTALWTEQRRIDALQDSLIRELQESVAAAKQESADLAQRRAETVLASAGGSSHPDFPVVNAGTSWSLGGSLSAGDAVRVTRWVRGENGELLNPSSWQAIISGTGPVPGTAGLGSDAFIEVARMSTPLVVRRFSWTLPSQVTATQEYYSIPGMSVRVDKGTGLFDVSARVRWVSGWGWYSMQIVRSDGTVLADRRDEGRSNIFVRYPLEQQLTVRGVSIPAGQSVFVRVLPGSHRDIGSASWAGSWTEKK
ncbi:hypothetical protein M3G47_01225 [Corynebacterium sanguinis]|uniref:hypothetical protein n=1 Tax=Corynebacterium sanguinis TaxID=2594913 RepID=UPI0021A94FCF|nr:hypothetical protein [Corynebacterium sanguinis]MCT1491359.1 hypothetical protein [Corynebacterium sanguinis]MCT2246722.1 hypothetical protein [Corynebacterium sanguinis]